MTSLFFKSILVISLLVVGTLPFKTANDLVAKANPSCDQTNQRTISLRVENKAGIAVDNFRPEDLSLLENKSSREILKLERRTHEPLSVAILIDTSASQERTLAGTKIAAQKFVELILNSNKDRAAVVSFTGEATIEQDLTNDLTKLRAAIDRVKLVLPAGYLGGGIVMGRNLPNRTQMLAGSTAIWDTIRTTVDGIQPTADSRRLIVLLTDGEDTISKTKLRDAIEHAATNDLAIFSIGIADEKYVGLNRDSLKRLSEETGGGVFFPKKAADLDSIFSELAQALQSRYVLSYCAASSKPAVKPPKIQIEVKNPQVLQSNVRLSYPHYSL